MNWLRGYKGDVDREKLVDALHKIDGVLPSVCAAAADLLHGDRHELHRGWRVARRKHSTVIWLRSRAKAALRQVLSQDPEWYGLERIRPGEIAEAMTARELAEFCGVPIGRVRKLAHEAPGNGLPEADWPLGRTLRGRAWRFPPDIAREYAEHLLK